jgi:SAM-dependent methyltransferase
MNINWKVKSFAFHKIDTFSLHRTLYFLQRNVTRRSRTCLMAGYKSWLVHQDHLAVTLEHPNIFEFGAGKSLSQNIFLSPYCESQTVVDLFPMLNIDLVNDAVSEISTHFPEIAYHPIANISDIERYYGIHYMSPFDAARTPFDEDTFDACISTDTLEHIPENDIVAIFKELRRIVRPGGLISAVIDYSDHYSHTDRRVGPLNYLRYSTAEFKKYNHTVHYQNRLRHYDYARIFDALGYHCLKNEAADTVPLPGEIADEFRSSDPSLCALRGVFLLENAKTAAHANGLIAVAQ